MHATQKAAVDAVTAIIAVCSEVVKMSGRTESDWEEGRKFLTSQYNPRGMPVSAFPAVKSVIIAEATYKTAAVKKIVSVLNFFFLKKAFGEGGCWCRGESKAGRCLPIGRSNFMVVFLFRMCSGGKNTMQGLFRKFFRLSVKNEPSAS